MLLFEIAAVLWAFLPAYVPNNAAVVFGGGTPIDGGREWRRARLLGDGKTWRGLAAGTGVGFAVALVLNRLNVEFFASMFPVFDARTALALALGAMLGDIGASFVKRRLDRERGSPVLGLDQLDFLAGALALALVVSPLWVTTLPGIPMLVVVLLTPLAHVGANRFAFRAGLKAEPW